MMEIRATRRPAWTGDGIEIRIGNPERHEFVTGLQVGVLKEGDYAPAAVTLKVEQAQQLMDSLWDCGLRPSEGTGSAGALAAVERHLADMKRIAFHALKIEGGRK